MKTEGLTIQEAVKRLKEQIMDDLIASGWKLVNPKPKMEEVEVSRWINVRRNGRIGSYLYESKMEAIDCSKHWAEPATQKEIKIKVEREVEDE